MIKRHEREMRRNNVMGQGVDEGMDLHQDVASVLAAMNICHS